LSKVNDFEIVTYRHPTYDADKLKELAEYSSGRILDVGFNQNPNPFARIDTGIDINLQEKPENYNRIVKVNAENFTTKVKTKFDTILASDIIEYLENPSSFLRECHKALNNNGTLLISTPTPYYLPYVFFEMINNQRFFFRGSHLNTFPPRIMLKLLKYNGFRIDFTEGSYLFSKDILYVCSKIKSRKKIIDYSKEKKILAVLTFLVCLLGTISLLLYWGFL
jgi:predicted TPR repeat methyltransferase